ncbi:MAG TPA: C4-dicarboxylate TRAP transporter substrate-binding protein [Alphaproteobacteria bacterium]|nr:C4-dicarboxylate TRAP transporter substrate-binding protein [Alphaproteobacteria bacterium]
MSMSRMRKTVATPSLLTLVIVCAALAVPLLRMTPAMGVPAQALAGSPTASGVDIKPMTLKVAEQLPPTGFASEMRKWWMDEITARTGGKVKFQVFWSQSLLKGQDMASGLTAGIAQIANVASTYDPARTALWMTLDMPYNAKDYWCGISASRLVSEEEPHLRASFEKLGFMPLLGYSSGQFHFLSKTPLLKLADLQGRRIRSYGGARVKWMEELKIAPVFMNYGDIYEAVERGVVDGAEATIYLTEAFKHYEIAKHLTKLDSGFVVAASLSINLKVWNSFPASLQQVFRDVSREHDMAYARKLTELEGQLLKKFQAENGLEYHELPPADRQALEDAGKQAQEKWLTEMESKGIPARATWAKFMELVKTCEAEVAANGYPWAKR